MKTYERSAAEQIAFLLRFDIRVINQLKNPFIFGLAVVDAISHSLWGHIVRSSRIRFER